MSERERIIRQLIWSIPTCGEPCKVMNRTSCSCYAAVEKCIAEAFRAGQEDMRRRAVEAVHSCVKKKDPDEPMTAYLDGLFDGANAAWHAIASLEIKDE